MYIKLPDTYPYSVGQLRTDNPNVSFPAEMPDERLADWGVFPVAPTPVPPYNTLTHKVVELLPVQIAGQWVQVWDLVPLTEQELQAAKQELQEQIIEATQQRLDDFARTRNYDGMLSLCTYATSTVPKFAAEGQYGVEARDATWLALYEILADVESGVRPPPAGFADIESDLPPLTWPSGS